MNEEDIKRRVANLNFDFSDEEIEATAAEHGYTLEEFKELVAKYTYTEEEKAENRRKGNINFCFFMLIGAIYLSSAILVMTVRYVIWGLAGIGLSWIVEFIRRKIVGDYWSVT
ncbi:MAG: hypothetical protein IJ763_04565 [Lachnospiraceae bacterium]|nr:hypothetical protein [Lachnospiraceae bacterium]